MVRAGAPIAALRERSDFDLIGRTRPGRDLVDAEVPAALSPPDAEVLLAPALPAHLDLGALRLGLRCDHTGGRQPLVESAIHRQCGNGVFAEGLPVERASAAREELLRIVFETDQVGLAPGALDPRLQAPVNRAQSRHPSTPRVGQASTHNAVAGQPEEVRRTGNPGEFALVFGGLSHPASFDLPCRDREPGHSIRHALPTAITTAPAGVSVADR